MKQQTVELPQSFWGSIQGEVIYFQAYDGTKQQIGVSLPAYQELQRTHKELLVISEQYKTRLIELGEIEVPLTQEQIIAEQTALLKESQEIMRQQAGQLKDSQELAQRLAAQIELLAKNKKETGNEHTLPDSRNRREKPAHASKNDRSMENGRGD